MIQYFSSFIKKNSVTIALTAMLLGFIVYQRFPQYLKDRQISGRVASDFELQDQNGRKIKLSDYKGKAVLLSFWATWCLPCRAEIPILKELQSSISDTNFVLLSVNAERKSDVLSFIKEHEITYPVLFDEEGGVHERFGVNMFPTMVFIDREGKINDLSHGIDFFARWKIRYLASGSIF